MVSEREKLVHRDIFEYVRIETKGVYSTIIYEVIFVSW